MTGNCFLVKKTQSLEGNYVQRNAINARFYNGRYAGEFINELSTL